MITLLSAFLIAETYVPDGTLILVAKAVLRAQDIQEESWVPERSAYACNFSCSAKQAVDETGINEMWASIISDWNRTCWNDCQSWAQAILERKTEDR